MLNSTKLFVFLFLSCFSFFNYLQAQKELPNLKIGKKEFEVSGCFLGSNYSEFGTELLYRLPVNRVLKIGGGIKLAYGSLNHTKADFYPVVLLDAARYIGRLQKWSINFQPSYSFHSRQDGTWPGYDPAKGFYNYSIKQKMGFSFLIGGNHRAILSGKLQLVTGLFTSYQYVKTKYFQEYQSNPGQIQTVNWNKLNFGGGVRIGLIF